MDKKLQLRLLAIAGIMAIAAVFPLAALANNSWGNFHWARTSNPFTLNLGDNVSSTWDPYLAQASSDWSASTVLDTTIVAGSKTKCTFFIIGRAEVCNARYGNTGWLGVAQIYTDGDHIQAGVVRMNDTYFNQQPYKSPAWRRLVMCQEIGHIFGLDHQDVIFDNPNLGTCMDYTSDPDGPPSNEHPNQHDYDQLVTIYTQLDTTTTVGASVSSRLPAAANGDLSAPDQWGRLIRESNGGRTALYERDFGVGHRVFTFVIRA
jgi:hypothetical protein